MTIAKVYGLKENPFEPTGAAVGKYPFVPPANLPILERKIEEAGMEKKIYALLVNSPHGAGKSTTMEYIKTKAVNGGYLSFRAPVILTKLSSLSIQDFVFDILDEATKYTKIKATSQLEKSRSRPSSLRKELVKTLALLASRNKLMLWIVDEFDILADQPEQQQRLFLQFLRSLIDDLAAGDVPIAFIMSHTKYSSREFEAHLSKQHEPFRSRLVASLPLAYSFEEVEKIVSERLRIADPSARQEGDLAPFSREALKSLHDLILSVRGTDLLDNFRVFERICHFALIEGAKKGLKEITVELIQDLFNQYGLKEIPIRAKQRLSLRTAQKIAAINIKSAMEKNEAVFKGFLKGVAKNESMFGSVNNVHTSFLGQVGEGNVGISALSFDLIRQDKSISISWTLAASTQGIIQEKDIVDVLEVVVPLLQGYEAYSHLNLFSYVSNVDVLKIPANPFDEVLWLSNGLAEDLIGLSVGADEDFGILFRSFNGEIAPRLSQLITREILDVTSPLSQSAIEAIMTLNIMSASGMGCTKEAVRQYNKRLFMRKAALQKRYLNEAVQSGFAKDEAGQIKPSSPKAHIHLLDLLEKGPREHQELLGKFGSAGKAIIESAIALGFVYQDDRLIIKRRLAEFEEKIAETIGILQKAHQDPIIQKSEPGQWIEWLLMAYKSSKESGQAYTRYIILSTIQKLAPQIKVELRKISSVPSKPISTQVPQLPIPQPTVRTTEAEPSDRRKSQLPPTGPTIPVENSILQIVKISGPLSIQEIDKVMKNKGYETDIKAAVFSLILSGKLKIVSSG